MKINKKEAEWVVIKEPTYEYIKAVKKPKSNLKITKETWFKGDVESLRKLVGVARVHHGEKYWDFTVTGDRFWREMGIEEV